MELLPDSLRIKAIKFRNQALWLLNNNQLSFSFAGANETESGLTGLLETIETRRPDCFFISPHLDDAVLSAGSLIHHLSRITNVAVATVFTEVDPKVRTAKWSRKCGFESPEIFVETRKQEDIEALTYLGVDVNNIHHLGYIDAECRTDKDDTNTMQDVYNTVLQLTDKSKDPITRKRCV